MDGLQHIIDKCVRQDRQSQRVLYEKYYGFALKVSFRYTGSHEKAVDVVNDGFVKVFQHLTQFHTGEAVHVEALLLGWIKKIMIHTAIDHLRKEKRRTHEVLVDPQQSREVPAQGAPDEGLLYKDLIGYLGNLSEGYRVVFNMSAIDGYSYTEIAQILGISSGTVRSNFFKAKKTLQEMLKRRQERSIYVRPE